MPKKESMQAMFDNIAPTYDQLNHILSLNIDKIWRKKAVKRLRKSHPHTVLDLACGTGDSSIALARAGIPKVVGIDLSEKMLEIAQEKARIQGINTIGFQTGDALALPFEDQYFDAVMIAFGIRNFENREEGLKEVYRVLKTGGKLLVLELSVPQSTFLKAVYRLYFLHLLPCIGKWISGDKKAYRYLPQSVLHFPTAAAFMKTVKDCNYRNIRHQALSCGLCRIFEAEK